jgi:hypothetical protein
MSERTTCQPITCHHFPCSQRSQKTFHTYIDMNTQATTLLLFTITVLFTSIFCNSKLDVAYAFSIGTPSFDSANAITHAFGDGFYVTGSAGRGTIKFNTTEQYSFNAVGAFVAKYASNGQVLWVHTFPSSNGNDVYATNSEVFAVGRGTTALFSTSTGAGAYLVKYSTDGEQLWAKQFGDAYVNANKVAVSTGGIFIVGTSTNTFTVGSVTLAANVNGDVAFVMKFSTSGEALWGYRFSATQVPNTGSPEVSGTAAATDKDGNVIMGGSTFGTMIINGQTYTHGGSRDAFVIKYNAAGTFQWCAYAGSNSVDEVDDIVTDENNNVYVLFITGGQTFLGTTTTTGVSSCVLAKYSPGGTMTWARRMSSNYCYPNALAYSSKGTIYVGGKSYGPVTFNSQSFTTTNNAFVAEYSSTGQELWFAASADSGSEVTSLSEYNNELFAIGQYSAATGMLGNFRTNNPGEDSMGSTQEIFIEKYAVLEDCTSVEYKNADVCTQKPVCVTDETCTCKDGYGGTYCNMDRKCNSTLFDSDSVCNSAGVCVDDDECSCIMGYDGQFCQFFNCSEIDVHSSEVCSSHGSCISPDVCKCEDNWSGSNCQEITCSGIKNTDNDHVCNGRGSCIALDTCDCDNGWSGNECQATTCSGVNSTDTSVCSGHGQCHSTDTCTCADGFFGSNCETVYSCYGKQATAGNACSGHGKCIAIDTCSCVPGYAGYNCQRSCDYCYLNYA